MAEFFIDNNKVICEINGILQEVSSQESISSIIQALFPRFTSITVEDARIYRENEEGQHPFDRMNIQNVFSSSWSNLIRLYPGAAFQFDLKGVLSAAFLAT